MKFVMSFSGGKDSILALHKMIEAGHEAVALLVMFKEQEERSWVHGLDVPMLEAIAGAMNIPLLCCHADMKTYAEDMERYLKKAQEMGAEACAFGDIDIEDHRKWDEERCTAVGMKAFLPLWGCDRTENVREVIRQGYRCVIKCVRNGMLPESLLGKNLSEEVLEEMKKYDVDLCGENGEYHTVVVDGPLFKHPVELQEKGIVHLEYVTAVELVIAAE